MIIIDLISKVLANINNFFPMIFISFIPYMSLKYNKKNMILILVITSIIYDIFFSAYFFINLFIILFIYFLLYKLYKKYTFISSILNIIMYDILLFIVLSLLKVINYDPIYLFIQIKYSILSNLIFIIIFEICRFKKIIY